MINSIKRHCHIYFTLFLDTFYIYLCWRDHPCKILNFSDVISKISHRCFFTSVGPQDTHCHTMYLLQLGTGFDRVLNTLALYGVVQLNSQTNASFTKTMSLCFCHLLAQELSKSVSFPNAMVQLVLMGGGVMASSLVPAETSFYIQV